MLDILQLPEPLRDTTERLWKEFENRRQAQQLPPLEQLLGDRITSKSFSQQITRVFATSEFIAKTCITHPGLLDDLIQTGHLYQSLGQEGYDQIQKEAAQVTTDADLDRVLRQHRRRAMVRIIWRDLTRLAALEETTSDMSRFADTAIQLAARYHYQQLTPQFGTPTGSYTGKAQPFIVLGMGKLGACELNVSSDIDLIFTYPEGGETQGGSRSIGNQDFFVRLGQRVIKSLDAPTADGFVFRVDMRLRPYGQSGALALSFDALEDYYQNQGRDWERYAMIKARPVAAEGGESAKDYERQLMALLQPFTYRQYIDFSVIESLRDMKGLISRQVQRKGMNLDVKLGEGGIREVEFVVQVFQLIRGGRDPRLRERRVRVLLPFLEQENYLPEGTGKALLEAYDFLRNTEHAIQGYQDRQTQALPLDVLGQLRLAWAMGFDTWDDFAAELSIQRAHVAQAFHAVIADPDAEDDRDEQALEAWLALWEGSVDDEQASALLISHQCSEPDRVLALVNDLRESRQVLAMQASSRTRLDAFVPRLLRMLGEQSAAEALAVPAGETLARIFPLVESIVRRSAYLVLLVENPVALQQLVRLCAASPWIADQLAHHPALLDELLTPESLYAPPDKDALRDELRRDVLRLTWDDLDGHMETLRYFRSAHALRVAASEVTNALPLMKVSDYLTFIAEVILEHVLTLAWEQLVARHGYPQRADGARDTAPNFIVVGYGKLGGIELGHGSDLDLVFIHNTDPGLSTDGEKSLDNLTFYTRLGQRIIHILNTQTLSGKLYEVDMRLRPSGNSGMLVSSLAAFEKYQLNDAWTWEHQALVRARVVAGDATLAQHFNEVRSRVLCQPRELPGLRHDVATMREKMRGHLGTRPAAQESGLFNLKQDAGGIVDIEFMVQYAVLAWASQEPALTDWTDNIRILGTLEEAGLLAGDSVAQLIDAYKAFRSTGHRLALQRQEAVLHGDDLFIAERHLVQNLWRQLLEPDGISRPAATDHP